MKKRGNSSCLISEVSQENRRIHNFQLIAPWEELCSIAKGKLFSQLYRCSKNRGRRSPGFSIDTCSKEPPEFESMFNVRDQSDGSHPRRLAATVLAYASNIDRLHMLESAITSIGRKHISLNVRPEQYPIVGKHLLEAVKTVLGDAATPELLDAWAAAYTPISRHHDRQRERPVHRAERIAGGDFVFDGRQE
jgi:hemoglobin-like flavoprotein